MGKPHKNIDELFQKGLKDFEEDPSLKAWDGIEQKLNQLEKEDNKKGLFWYKGISVLAFLFSITALVLYYENKNDSRQKHLFISEDQIPVKQETISENNNSKQSNKSKRLFSDKLNGDGINSDQNNNIIINSNRGNNISNALNHEPYSPISFVGEDSLNEEWEVEEVENLLAFESYYSLPEPGMKAKNIEHLALYLPKPMVTKLEPLTMVQPKLMLPKPYTYLLKRFSISASYAQELVYRFKTSGNWSIDWQDLFQNDTNFSALSSFDARSSIKEKPLFNFSSSLNVFYDLNHRLSIGTGITYAIKGQKIEYNNIKYNPMVTAELYEINTTNSYGDYSTTFYTTDGEAVSLNQMIQLYKFIEIPFMIKYEALNLKRVSFNTTLGASLNYMLSSSAYLSIEDANQLSYSAIANQLTPFNRWSAGAILKMGMSYSMTPNIRLELEPFFKTNVSPLVEQTYPFSIGINCGINYHF
jgi:hypothetical protein